MTSPINDRPFPVDPEGLLPAITPDNEAHWTALTRGEIVLQQCDECRNIRYPIAPVCPSCGSTKWDWKSISGRGKVFSWVRYQRSYLPEFQDLMPYAVAVVQLDEGARIFGRLIEDDRTVRIDATVEAVIERWPNGRCVPAFRLAGEI